MLSWVLSPVLSGALAVLLLAVTNTAVLRSTRPEKRALLLCPVVVWLSVFCASALVLLKAPAVAQSVPPPVAWATAFGIAVLAAVLTQTLLVPVIRAQFHSDTYEDCADGDGDDDDDDENEMRRGLVRAVLSSSFDDKTHCDTSNDDSERGGGGGLSAASSSPLPCLAIRVQAVAEAGVGVGAEPGSGPGGGIGAVPDDTPDSVASVASVESSDEEVEGSILNHMHEDVAATHHQQRQRQPSRSQDAGVVFRWAAITATATATATTTARLFQISLTPTHPSTRYLLVITACLESFSHGSNDTANASAAFSFIYDVYATSGRSCAGSSGGNEGGAQGSPVWILVVAGFFVALGVVVAGHRVIATMGTRLVQVSFHRGWCIELSSAATVLLASLAGLPVSSTHCQVLLSSPLLSPLSSPLSSPVRSIHSIIPARPEHTTPRPVQLRYKY